MILKATTSPSSAALDTIQLNALLTNTPLWSTSSARPSTTPAKLRGVWARIVVATFHQRHRGQPLLDRPATSPPPSRPQPRPEQHHLPPGRPPPSPSTATLALLNSQRRVRNAPVLRRPRRGGGPCNAPPDLDSSLHSRSDRGPLESLQHRQRPHRTGSSQPPRISTSKAYLVRDHRSRSGVRQGGIPTTNLTALAPVTLGVVSCPNHLYVSPVDRYGRLLELVVGESGMAQRQPAPRSLSLLRHRGFYDRDRVADLYRTLQALVLSES